MNHKFLTLMLSLLITASVPVYSNDCAALRQYSQMQGHAMTDYNSCVNFCEANLNRGGGTNCNQICSLCYAASTPESANEAATTTEDDFIDPRATKTERALILFVQKHGKKEVSENGTITFQMADMSKKLSKAAKFSGRVRSINPNPYGCSIKLNELDGTQMELLGTGATGKSRKLCKKLKVGKKMTIAPDSITYVFMKYNPFRNMTNQGMLMVLPK